jgi:hypothetical protein
MLVAQNRSICPVSIGSFRYFSATVALWMLRLRPAYHARGGKEHRGNLRLGEGGVANLLLKSIRRFQAIVDRTARAKSRPPF